MFIIYGRQAYSRFKLSKWQQKFSLSHPQKKTNHAHWVYFVDGKPTELDKLKIVIRAEEKIAPQADLIKCPRIGTLTPWSTKASNILQLCNLAVDRIEKGVLFYFQGIDKQVLTDNDKDLFFDPLTETILENELQAQELFIQQQPSSYVAVDIFNQGKQALVEYNNELGLALSNDEIDYLLASFNRIDKKPSDVELMMFAQANSEHCRHKIFNAKWIIDGEQKPDSLFKMIKNTYQHCGDYVLSAYHDNAAVSVGNPCQRFYPKLNSSQYHYHPEHSHLVMKVETHNHPTGIAPNPGAATGAGGEIRDEGATGRGAKPKAGLCGFSVANLDIPDLQQPWELSQSKPHHLASALTIMLDGPIGAAAFNNEFGRPNLCGYFRTYDMTVIDDGIEQRYSYFKPIMIAGGLGSIRQSQIEKQAIAQGMPLVVLGGPAMNIGLGGGAASSKSSGEQAHELDFASVQRANPEMQRRCQEVIDRCWAFGEDNPIAAIHDVGAGGLSNAMPELVHDSDCGGQFNLRAIPNAEPGLSPLAIWCNEAQERYVLAIFADKLAQFEKLCQRERCPYAVIGNATEKQQLSLHDNIHDNNPIDLPMSVLFGNTPELTRTVDSCDYPAAAFVYQQLPLEQVTQRVLQLPAVAAKNFLITIGDRSVGGLVSRDQMVGPWQVPVADCAVTLTDFISDHGEAMAMGERAPVAVLNPAAAARLCVAEAITNIAGAPIDSLKRIKLSANWMAAAADSKQNYALYQAVEAIGMDFCPKLGLTIPVGKDSLSMQTRFNDDNGSEQRVISPLSLVISAFAPVSDVTRVLTPQLNTSTKTRLLLLDLGQSCNRLGGSAMMQVYNQIGESTPDIDAKLLSDFFSAMQSLHQQQLALAYHDRSDGGLYACLLEMAFAGQCGLAIDLSPLSQDYHAVLFNEELGAVIQVADSELAQVLAIFEQYNLTDCVHDIGKVCASNQLTFTSNGQILLAQQRSTMQRLWQQTSFKMQSLRDNPDCAEQEFDLILDEKNPGLNPKLSFAAPLIAKHLSNPPIAILREQGVNGQIEMAAAFDRAGFESHDIHMSDLISGRQKLSDYAGLVACGGFSYGDVLGAGRGWAATILNNPQLKQQFAQFFARGDSFTLGVCNGCQMLSQLKSIIPGANFWPEFVKNESHQFEARLSMVAIEQSPSLFFTDMAGSQLPVVVSHGEGRINYGSEAMLAQAQENICLRYIDNYGEPTQSYPANPNGSVDGQTGLCSADGRVTIMMPHPERLFKLNQFSWRPDEWQGESPWMQLFINAYKAVK